MISTTDTKLTQYINSNYNEADTQDFDLFSQQLFDCSLNNDIQVLTMPQRYRIALPLWKTFSSHEDNIDKVIIDSLSQQGMTGNDRAWYCLAHYHQ